MRIAEFIKENRIAIILGLSAIIVRAAYLVELSFLPGFEIPIIDEKWHWEWAQDILNRSFIGDTAYFRAPLYPYVLALLAKLSGGSILGTKLLQILFAGGSCFFTVKIAQRLFGNMAGIIAGITYALYGTLIFYETMFLIPALFLFLCLWAMYRVVVADNGDHGNYYWLVTGVIFGLAAISRPNVLLVIPVLMIWRYFVLRKDFPKLRFKQPAMLLLGLIMIVAPITARNLITTGEFILISSQGGINLYLGNNPESDGLTMLMPEVDLDESISWREFGKATREAAEREAGTTLSDGGESAFWTGKALSFIADNPGKFLSMISKKTVYLLTGFENSDNTDLYYQRKQSVIFRLLTLDGPLFLPFGLLLPLSLLGIVLAYDRRQKLMPLYLFLIAYIPSIVLFLVTARHRLALVPLLIILAAGGLTTLVRKWENLSVVTKVVGAMILIGITFLLNQTYFDQHRGSAFQIHFNNAIRFERLSDWESAEREYLLADRVFPASAALINNLGYTQYRLEKFEQADKSYHRSLALEPTYSRALNNLGLLVQDKGLHDSALVLLQASRQYTNRKRASANELGQVFLNLGISFEAAGQLDSATMAFDSTVLVAPLNGDYIATAASYFARIQSWERMDSLYTRSSSLRGELAMADYFNWGLASIQRGQLLRGVNLMTSAIKRDKNLFQGYYCIAAAYHQGGHPADSVYKYLDVCLEIEPSYEPALQLKKVLEGE